MPLRNSTESMPLALPVILGLLIIAGCSDSQEEAKPANSDVQQQESSAVEPDPMNAGSTQADSISDSQESKLDQAGDTKASEVTDVSGQLPDEVKQSNGADVRGSVVAPAVSDLSDGDAYLFINRQKPSVKELASGLQFEILKQGDGKTPSLTSNVVTHYHGTFTDGEVFDSSKERGQPAEFPVNRVIKGWTEALQLMKEGDVWRLVIPPELAYGKRGTGLIPPNAVLVFEVELIEVKS